MGFFPNPKPCNPCPAWSCQSPSPETSSLVGVWSILQAGSAAPLLPPLDMTPNKSSGPVSASRTRTLPMRNYRNLFLCQCVWKLMPDLNRVDVLIILRRVLRPRRMPVALADDSMHSGDPGHCCNIPTGAAHLQPRQEPNHPLLDSLVGVSSSP